MSDMSLIYQGRCWKLGDDVSSDELISAQHVFEYDPQVLRKHLLEERLSQFASQAQSPLFGNEGYRRGANRGTDATSYLPTRHL